MKSSSLNILFLCALANCAADTTDQSRTAASPTPKAAFAEFRIVSGLPSPELVNVVERLFRQDPLLRDALSCSRYGPNAASLDCGRVVGKDVFAAVLESGKASVVLSLVPRSQDPGYRPDYARFAELRQAIDRALQSQFGEANVAVR